MDTLTGVMVAGVGLGNQPLARHAPNQSRAPNLRLASDLKPARIESPATGNPVYGCLQHPAGTATIAGTAISALTTLTNINLYQEVKQ